jgi:glycosyltransferase involved in cell wall biosynthesis
MMRPNNGQNDTRSLPPEARPLVSVIIPTYDSARFIADAVRSVMAQTYPCHEVIVIDDGSGDETAEIVRGLTGQIRYRRQEHRGVAAARNAGIKIARGQYICFLDADDLWTPDKLELQVEFMAAHSDVGLAFADAEESEDRTILKSSIVETTTFHAAIVSQVPLQDAFTKLVQENFIPTSSVMIRKDCFLRAGLFDESLRVVEDRDMWLRVAAAFEIACLPKILARKRRHGANISARTELTARSRIMVWEKARRRFPSLAPAAVYNKLLASTYQELGYIQLSQADGSAARRSGMASLNHAMRYVVATKALFPYRWLLSVGLIPLSFISWPLVRSLWQARNHITRRNSPPGVEVRGTAG